jgi:hypothetical protein
MDIAGSETRAQSSEHRTDIGTRALLWFRELRRHVELLLLPNPK